MSWLKEELQFTRMEFLGLLGIISLGMIGVIIQYLPAPAEKVYELRLSDILVDEELITLDEVIEVNYEIPSSKKSKKYKQPKTAKKIHQERQVFDFDPNLVSKESLVKLGFKNYLAERWVKFRSAGKEYQKIEDVLSVYGIDTNLVIKLKDHMQFASTAFDDNKLKDQQKTYHEKEKAKTFEVKLEKALPIIDLNSCTQEDLKQLRGIGKTYASRIIKYRSILGGYSSKDQLLQVYGMTDSTYWLVKDQLAILSPPEKIRINTASQKQLTEHYLLSYKMSKLIYVYREEHGSFVDEDDFKAIKGIEEDKIKKIIPYLDFAL